MQVIHSLAMYIHIVLGSIALVVFWLPVAVRKGSPFHKRSGRWFVRCMYAVSVSGLIMSTLLLVDPIGVRHGGEPLSRQAALAAAEGIRLSAAFLLMLSVLVFASVRHSMLVLGARGHRGVLRSPAHLLIQIMPGALGLPVGALGLIHGKSLLIIFAVISALVTIGMLRYTFKRELSRNEWWIAHLGSIIGAGIGAYTAFFAFGGSRLLAEVLNGQWQILPWVLPSVVGTFYTARLTRFYRRKFSGGT